MGTVKMHLYFSKGTTMSEPRFPIHVICYGNAGNGKSTLAATFPKPILV